MITSVNIHAAKTSLSELIERVEQGEEITIARAGKPVARLAPLLAQQRIPGLLEGKLWFDDDIDQPMSKEEAEFWY